MAFPKCQVPTRKQWSTSRDLKGGKDGLSKHSMGKSLDKFHSAIASAEKTSDVPAALEACESLSTVFQAYLSDVEKLKKYVELVKYLKTVPIYYLKEFKGKLEDEAEGDKDYSEDIKAAQRIAQEWKDDGHEWLKKLTARKADFDEVENWWERVASAITKGETRQPVVLEEMELRVKQELKNLPKLSQEGLKTYNDFKSWALLGPRAGYTTINSKLKLGDVTLQRGAAVAKACKVILSEVSGVIGQVDNLWLKEMTKQQETLEQRGQNLLKVLGGEVNLLDLERERLGKELSNFNDQVFKIFEDSLKVKADVLVLSEVLKAKSFDPQKHASWEGRPTQLRKRQATLPQFVQLLEKQVNKIKDKLPQQLANAPEVKDLDEAHKDAVARLKQADVLYTKTIDALGKLGIKD